MARSREPVALVSDDGGAATPRDGQRSEPCGADWVAQQVEEMAAAWRRGERPSVIEILTCHPELDDEAAVRLIYEEVCLRRESGQDVATAEVVRQFPRWQAELELLLGCDRLMWPPLIEFPRVGEHLGDFQLLDELGRGTSGRTFLAAQPLLADRPVILKVTTLDHNEHLSLARLQHTHVVPLYSEQVFPERGLRALCMPYLGGGNLAQILNVLAQMPADRRSGMHLLQALDRLQASAVNATPLAGPYRAYLEQATYVQSICWIAACLADALHYAHERGLVHMDVKPSNVLISSDGQPMLLDFHLACAPLRPGVDRPDRLGGTPGWMSPEQQLAMRAVAAEREVTETVDGRADLFSLGLLVYEALGGAAGTAELANRPRLDRCNPRVSLGLADVVHRCLAEDPTHRYQDAASLADDLRRHLNDLPLRGVSNRSWMERWKKWRRRQPHALFYGSARLSILAASVAVAALVGSFYHQRFSQIDDALADARRLQAGEHFDEAIRTSTRGLLLAKQTPAAGDLRRALEEQLLLARRGRKAQDLHRLADLIRFHDGIAPSSLEEMQSLARQCRRVWEERALLSNANGVALSPETEKRIVFDLRELAVIGADLRVRLAAPTEVAGAHREALRVLDQAEASLGPSPALIRERQVHAEAIGLTDDSRLPDLRPRSPWEHYDLGRSLLRSGQFAAAAEEFRLTLDQRPQDFWPNFSQGLCAYHLGQFGEALGAFRACVTLAPRLPECYYNRALAYEALGQANEARRDYTRSIELDPQLAGAFLNRGILSYKAGRPLEAIADFRQALGCSPGREMTGRIHYNLALAHSILGDRGSALAEREKAVEAGSREASALDESLRPGR